jgi:protein required for attachment to host cells
MSRTVPNNALAVVADGCKARLFRNAGHGQEVRLHEDAHLTPQDLANEAPSGSRPEEQTPRQTGEATFAKQLVRRLDAMRQQGACDHLVLAAEPQTRGQMRHAMSTAVADSIVLSVAKDLTNHPAQDVADALG